MSEKTLFGVDVHAKYQKGLQANKLPNVDFVITKCSGGKGLVIDGWEKMLNGSTLTGVYHYAREKGTQGTAKEEAANFIAQAKKAPEDAMLVLDWEESTDNNLGDTDWVLEWCQLVEKSLKRKPVIYTGNNVLKSYSAWWDWSNKYDYYLWYARYPYSTAVGWQNYDFPSVPNWPDAKVAMWQYSSAGGIDGWSGALDLNIFYGDKNKWKTVVGVSSTAETSGEETLVSSRTPAQAVSWAKNQVGRRGYAGMCEMFTRTAYGYSAKYGTAIAAYNASARAGKIHKSTNAPAGVPVFFSSPKYVPAGHVAISIGGGYAISTSDENGNSKICKIRIAHYQSRYFTYLGWAEVYHGNKVYSSSNSSTSSSSSCVATGLKVADVQNQLKIIGYYKGKIDNSAGSMTAAAVLAYQKAQQYYPGMKVDGIWGKRTQNHYDWVKKLQAKLNSRASVKATGKTKVDGDYGAYVKRLVEIDQKATPAYIKSRKADGLAGPYYCTAIGFTKHPSA